MSHPLFCCDFYCSNFYNNLKSAIPDIANALINKSVMPNFDSLFLDCSVVGPIKELLSFIYLYHTDRSSMAKSHLLNSITCYSGYEQFENILLTNSIDFSIIASHLYYISFYSEDEMDFIRFVNGDMEIILSDALNVFIENFPISTKIISTVSLDYWKSFSNTFISFTIHPHFDVFLFLTKFISTKLDIHPLLSQILLNDKYISSVKHNCCYSQSYLYPFFHTIFITQPYLVCSVNTFDDLIDCYTNNILKSPDTKEEDLLSCLELLSIHHNHRFETRFKDIQTQLQKQQLIKELSNNVYIEEHHAHHFKIQNGEDESDQWEDKGDNNKELHQSLVVHSTKRGRNKHIDILNNKGIFYLINSVNKNDATKLKNEFYSIQEAIKNIQHEESKESPIDLLNLLPISVSIDYEEKAVRTIVERFNGYPEFQNIIFLYLCETMMEYDACMTLININHLENNIEKQRIEKKIKQFQFGFELLGHKYGGFDLFHVIYTLKHNMTCFHSSQWAPLLFMIENSTPCLFDFLQTLIFNALILHIISIHTIIEILQYGYLTNQQLAIELLEILKCIAKDNWSDALQLCINSKCTNESYIVLLQFIISQHLGSTQLDILSKKYDISSHPLAELTILLKLKLNRVTSLTHLPTPQKKINERITQTSSQPKFLSKSQTFYGRIKQIPEKTLQCTENQMIIGRLNGKQIIKI
ncbi:Uncharacterized protein QTN25_000073 [Entamoeba marina]